MQFALTMGSCSQRSAGLASSTRLQSATDEFSLLARCTSRNLRNRMNADHDSVRWVGTTVAIWNSEMSSPHLSQRNGSAVREHRKSNGQDGRCAAGVNPFAKATGRCSTGPSLFLWPGWPVCRKCRSNFRRWPWMGGTPEMQEHFPAPLKFLSDIFSRDLTKSFHSAAPSGSLLPRGKSNQKRVSAPCAVFRFASANQNALRFSASAGSSDSTSIC